MDLKNLDDLDCSVLELRALDVQLMLQDMRDEIVVRKRKREQAQALAASKQPEQANGAGLAVFEERTGTNRKEEGNNQCLMSAMRTSVGFEHYTITNISSTGADYNPTERKRTTAMTNCPGCNMRRTEDGRVVPKRDANGEPLDPLENQQGHYGGCLLEAVE